MARFDIADKRVLSIQDISCFGKCSQTVVLPIISACGIETDIIPSAILSTHTGGFKEPVFRDLSEDMVKVAEHWKREGISFDVVYSGYLGNKKQIDYVTHITELLLKEEGIKIVDPVMADKGKLYKGFDLSYVEYMSKLCKNADIILPNITEACLLAKVEYKENYDLPYVLNLLERLGELTKAMIVLKGAEQDKDTISVFVKKARKEIKAENLNFKDDICVVSRKKEPASYHGTGDIFASVFIGSLMRGKHVEEAVKIAMDFVIKAIEFTTADIAHSYGVKFEKAIPYLLERL